MYECQGLTHDVFVASLCMVRKHTAREEVSSVASNHASERSVVEVRVGSNGLVESNFSSFSECVEVVGAFIRSHVVERLELLHHHGRSITGDIKVGPGVG